MPEELIILKTNTNTTELSLNKWFYSEVIGYANHGNHYWRIGYKIIPAKDMWDLHRINFKKKKNK